MYGYVILYSQERDYYKVWEVANCIVRNLLYCFNVLSVCCKILSLESAYFPDIYFSLWYILYIAVIVLLNAYVLIKYVNFCETLFYPLVP